jgi:YggT family protein
MLLSLVDKIFFVYMILLFVRILSSWIPEIRYWDIMRHVAAVTDPYLNFFRRFIPPLGMVDLSPIIAFLALSVIEWIVKSLVIMVIR